MRPPSRSWMTFGARTATAAAALALAWWLFYGWRSPTFVLTPFRSLAPAAPIYAFYLPQWSGGALLAAATLGAGLAGARLLARRPTRLFLAFVLAFAIAARFAVHAARSPELPGSELTTYPGEEVIYDVERVDSPLDFLRDYTSIQDQLSLHGRTKPPGFALLHALLAHWFGDRLTIVGSILTCLASLIVLPAYGLGRRLRGHDEDGRAAALLLAGAPGSVLFGAVSLDALFAVAAAAAFLAAFAEARRPSVWRRLLLGALLAFAMMLSYSAFLVGLFCGLLIVCERWREPARTAADLGTVLAGFLAPLALLFLYPGFDAWTCFVNARRLNAAMMSGIIGHATSEQPVWLYASIGNLLAFCIALGPAIVGNWGRPPFDSGRLPRSALAAFGITLAAASFGGLYLMETERTLLFLVPPALLPALARRDFKPGAAAVLACAQTLTMELLLRTLW